MDRLHHKPRTNSSNRQRRLTSTLDNDGRQCSSGERWCGQRGASQRLCMRASNRRHLVLPVQTSMCCCSCAVGGCRAVQHAVCRSCAGWKALPPPVARGAVKWRPSRRRRCRRCCVSLPLNQNRIRQTANGKRQACCWHPIASIPSHPQTGPSIHGQHPHSGRV
ncbi:hypothetical protein BC831DRAFT_449088 [Entophlyctis helioformis]|nr:hypothetical protein BC831DRAFT_449088 [Entophlyctis helioformis]